MQAHIQATTPFAGQKPGTSGLRKKARVFQQPGYLENFVQAIFDCVPGFKNHTLVLGSDGRYFTRQAIGVILKMAAGNGVARVILGAGGLLSTPAASCLIREYGAAGGVLLTASHNPGGPEGDFGVKLNDKYGGSAPQSVMDAIYARTQEIEHYKIADLSLPDAAMLEKPGLYRLDGLTIEVADAVTAYADLQERLFDFTAIRDYLQHNPFAFDAMNAVAGPYAVEIFAKRLGVPLANICNATPKEDFGGRPPDPTFTYMRAFYESLSRERPLALAAATDGDGDRNLMFGGGRYVSPSDLIAVLAANAHLVPSFKGGLKGLARTMPTSSAVDRVAARLEIPCYETPTGWKYFAELLEAGLISLCGEESAGMGGNHNREKDGLWAILFFLNILAVRQAGVEEVLKSHWRAYGRTFHRRYDYERLDLSLAQDMMADLQKKLPGLEGRQAGGRKILSAGVFNYQSPVTGIVAENQGLYVRLADGGRLAFRLSGTATSKATLRLYLEEHKSDARYFGAEYFDADPEEVLAGVARLGDELAGIRARAGRLRADAVT